MKYRQFRESTAKHTVWYLVAGVVVIALLVGFAYLGSRVTEACPFENPDQCSAVRCLSGAGVLCLLPLALWLLAEFGVYSFSLLFRVYPYPRGAAPSSDTEEWQQTQPPARPAGKYLDAEELLARYEAGDRDFSHAMLDGLDLEEANLSFAILRQADLRRANLSRANLYGATLAGADLRGGNLLDANLEGADLERATLRYANLIRTNLVGAKLSHADLRRARLRKANLRDALLHFADLRDADLSGADLTGAQTRANELDLAGSLSGATLPDGTVQP